MTPDLRICRTHDAADFGEYGNGNGPCCRAGSYPWATPCAPAAFVWSADGHALLEVVECDPTVFVDGLGAQPVVCPNCGGSGWKYAAATEHLSCGMAWPVHLPDGRVAVVPLKDIVL